MLSFNFHIEFYERIIAAHFSTTDLLPQVSTYTEPSTGGYFTCAEWENMTPQDLQTALGAAYGAFIEPDANLCTAQGDKHMYCLNDSGEKRYCHCEPVSSNCLFSTSCFSFFLLTFKRNGCLSYVRYINDNISWIGIKKWTGGTFCSTRIICDDNEDILFNFQLFR